MDRVLSILLAIFLGAFTVSAQSVNPTGVPSEDRASFSYGIVVDNSGSLRLQHDRIIEMIRVLTRESGDGFEGFLVTYIDPSKTYVRQEFTSEAGLILEAAENIYVEAGRPSLFDALRFSLDYFVANSSNDENVPRSLILFSDGEDRDSTESLDGIIRILKENSIRVFVVGLGDGRVNERILNRLANGSGGKLYLPKTFDERVSAANLLLKDIRTR
jgi:hypothetical protein